MSKPMRLLLIAVYLVIWASALAFLVDWLHS